MLVRFKTAPSIFNEVDTLINSALFPFPSINRTERFDRFTGVSVKDTGEQIQVNMLLPGVKKEDVKVQLNDGTLTITAERKAPETKENEQWIRNEITYGTIERSIALPYSVDSEKVTATQENGVLTIVLPKHETARPKQISIR